MTKDHPKKHYLIKTHRTHRVILYFIFLIIAISAVMSFLTYNMKSVSFFLDNTQNIMVMLLFLLNFNLIILIALFLWFVIDLKEALYEEEGLLTQFIKKK